MAFTKIKKLPEFYDSWLELYDDMKSKNIGHEFFVFAAPLTGNVIKDIMEDCIIELTLKDIMEEVIIELRKQTNK